MPARRAGTTACDVGIGYSIGPYAIGATWYGVDFDQRDYGATSLAGGGPNTGHVGLVRGVAVGGAYQVGPGVAVNFDYATASTRTPGALQTTPNGTCDSCTHGTLFAIGAYFEW